MSGPSTLWLAALIVLACGLALIRLGLWWRSSAPPARKPAWRFPVLIALNLAASGLLYLTLDPPDVDGRSGRLVVLTAGAPPAPAREPGDIVIALPEGPSDGAAERAPDLATALRRHAEVRAIQVLGAGLAARDRQTVDRPLTFVAPAAPQGLTALIPPDRVAPGAPFAVKGGVGALARGTVELVDPAGAVVDQRPVTAGATFALTGAARAAGLALFELRLKSAEGTVIERIEVPVEARDQPAPRVRVLAGAPGPETRFLRRWAEGAGIDLSIQLSLGAGVDLTAAPAPLTGRTLSQTDLLVIDERRWKGLSAGERGAVRSAVADGMGLLLRPTGPLSGATRREWAALGAPLTGGENTRPLTLDGRVENALPATDGGGADEVAPELTRRDFVQDGADAVTLLTDADGAPLSRWRPYGAGRVGVWVVADSYALALTGRSDRHGELWSRMFSALARPQGDGGAALRGLARVGARAIVCGVTEGSEVIAPDGRRARLVIDPRSGPGQCAAIWPTRSGWHAIRAGEAGESAVYILPEDASPSLVAGELSQATLDLAASPPAPEQAKGKLRRVPGSPWPWFLALLAVLTGLWWLERRRPA
jgi:hypothetical protein